MSWTVLSVAYPFAPVGPDAVGGAEQVLTALDRALVEAGHRSLVLAAAGSTVAGTLLPLPPVPSPTATIHDATRNTTYDHLRRLLQHAIAEHRPDILHFHGIDFLSYLPATSVPALATLHLPLSWYPADLFTEHRPNLFLHCVSATQNDTAPPDAKLLPPIPNGVDLQQFRPRGEPRNYAIALGRICPEKGFDIALRVCRATRSPLLIGGAVYPYAAHQQYFENSVSPLLDDCRRFLGPLALPRKAALLAKAKCLLLPSLAPETSSLVAMEALACGTPVIGFPSGAIPTLIDHGVTGWIVESEAEMIERMGDLPQLDRANCRRAAEARFGQSRMLEAYFSVYGRLTAKR